MTGDKTITLTIPRELQNLLVLALRYAADTAQTQVDSVQRYGGGKEFTDGFDQPGQCRWLATYIEHKLRDATPAPEWMVRSYHVYTDEYPDTDDPILHGSFDTLELAVNDGKKLATDFMVSHLSAILYDSKVVAEAA